jgi:hypothetical protein
MLLVGLSFTFLARETHGRPMSLGDQEMARLPGRAVLGTGKT